MARLALDDIEELARCSCCKRAFDDAEREPKLLACQHHFCLACTRGALGGGRDVRCAHCRKVTELPDGRADALPTHGAVLALARRLARESPCAAHALPALWCAACGVLACRACDHAHHAHHARALWTTHEARSALQRDTRMLRADLRRFAVRRRDFLLRALDAATAVKVRLEAELSAPPERASLAEGGCASPAAAVTERDRLRARRAEALLQCRLDDLIRDASAPLDFDSVRRALVAPGAEERPPSPPGEWRDPVLFLANYCAAQLYTRPAPQGATRVAAVEPDASECPMDALDPSPGGPRGIGQSNLTVGSPILRNPTVVFPLFYFNLEVNGDPLGRVVIEVREDVAPRMARNFAVLTTGELGVGYRGCTIFQCWENESVITGDFELNNGRGGRSVFEESFFMPDDTRMTAVRGSVGMRRSQRRHDNLGLVGSQFRIILREMRAFTAIFACVVEGLELVDQMSRAGDGAGKPHGSLVIAACGRLQ